MNFSFISSNATFSRSWVGFSDIDRNGNEKWLTGDVVGSGGYDNWRSGSFDLSHSIHLSILYLTRSCL